MIGTKTLSKILVKAAADWDLVSLVVGVNIMLITCMRHRNSNA